MNFEFSDFLTAEQVPVYALLCGTHHRPVPGSGVIHRLISSKPHIPSMKFSELALGQTASQTILITPEMVAAFADTTGDHNPLHTDPAYAEPRFGGIIAHGVLLVSFFSALLATELPGPGAVARALNVRFKAPARPGDQVRIEVKIVELVPRIRKVALEGRAFVGEKMLLYITAEALLEE
jgi:3-hydroxybutyryl-CoA dehydratase